MKSIDIYRNQVKAKATGATIHHLAGLLGTVVNAESILNQIEGRPGKKWSDMRSRHVGPRAKAIRELTQLTGVTRD